MKKEDFMLGKNYGTPLNSVDMCKPMNLGEAGMVAHITDCKNGNAFASGKPKKK